MFDNGSQQTSNLMPLLQEKERNKEKILSNHFFLGKIRAFLVNFSYNLKIFFGVEKWLH